MRKLLHLPAPDRPQTWERREGEPDHLWHLFLRYRDSAYPLGPGGPFKARNLQDLAMVSGLQYTEIVVQCQNWGWIQRAGAWDMYVQRHKDEQDLHEGIEKFRTKYQRLMSKISGITEVEIDKLLQRAQTLHDFNALEPKDLIALIKFSFDAEQKLQGDDQTQNTGEGWDLDKLTSKEIDQLRALHKKATGT